MTEFFVPGAEGKQAEEMYADLARRVGRAVPPLGQRIAAINFVSDGEEWTARVGEPLHGVQIQRRTPVSDSATVIAIFAGDPYMVWTDARPIGANVSAWENPFKAGQPRGVESFSQIGQ